MVIDSGARKGSLTAYMIRMARKHPVVIATGMVASCIVLCAILAPWIAPSDPNKVNMSAALMPPGTGALLGTDDAGRDVLSRIIYGSRLSLGSAGMLLMIASAVGTVLGLVSGYFGGWIDEAIMRLADIIFAFPGLILAMAVTAALGPGLVNCVLALAVVWWPTYARLVRGQVLLFKTEAFVEAAKSLGASEARVMLRHILPQCLAVLVARTTVDIGYAILLTATLGFLGLGTKPPTPEWGSMIAQSRPYFFSYWWTGVFPGLAMLVTVLVFSLFADGLYDIVNPKGK